MGVYTDGDKGWKRGYIVLLLSADARDLLWVQYPLAARFKIITRLQDNRWIVTSDMSGEPDHSGIEEEQFLPEVPFDVVYYHHECRLADLATDAVAFDPTMLVQDVLQHGRDQRDTLIARGLARHRDLENNRWSYTLRGALGIVAAFARMLATLPARMKEAKHRAQAVTVAAQSWKDDSASMKELLERDRSKP